MSLTNAQSLAAGIARLREAGVPDPARDARLLLAFVLGIGSDRLTLHLQDRFPQSAALDWQAALSARADRQPVSQITGQRLFYGRRFRVTSDVLDPRPETEILIERALEAPAARILDIGTGSGCILLTLLAEWPNAIGIGTDASAPALAVARQNAQSLGVAARCEFRRTHWALDVAGPFDLIVSNPPYITGDEMADLSPDVVRWEPSQALTPGPLGLESYQELIPQAADRLAAGGRLLLEIGPSQSADVTLICQKAALADIRTWQDLDGRNRLVGAKKTP